MVSARHLKEMHTPTCGSLLTKYRHNPWKADATHTTAGDVQLTINLFLNLPVDSNRRDWGEGIEVKGRVEKASATNQPSTTKLETQDHCGRPRLQIRTDVQSLVND